MRYAIWYFKFIKEPHFLMDMALKYILVHHIYLVVVIGIKKSLTKSLYVQKTTTYERNINGKEKKSNKKWMKRCISEARSPVESKHRRWSYRKHCRVHCPNFITVSTTDHFRLWTLYPELHDMTISKQKYEPSSFVYHERFLTLIWLLFPFLVKFYWHTMMQVNCVHSCFVTLYTHL